MRVKSRLHTQDYTSDTVVLVPVVDSKCSHFCARQLKRNNQRFRLSPSLIVVGSTPVAYYRDGWRCDQW